MWELSTEGLGAEEELGREGAWGANQPPAAHQLAGGGRHHLGVLSQVPLRQNRQWALPVSRRGGGERRPDCPKGGETPLGSRFFKIWDFCKSLSPLSLFLGAEILGLLYVGKFVILVKTTT